MKIDIAAVEHIARLSRLSLTNEEKEVFGPQLSGIIEYVETLGVLDTSDIEPTSHVIDMKNIMREDKLRPSLSLEDAMLNAPDPSDGFFRVPKIIE